jgi:hypothetical protein
MFKVCGRLKGLILYEGLILPQSRESAEVRARPYSLGAHRPCSARAITLFIICHEKISTYLSETHAINIRHIRPSHTTRMLPAGYSLSLFFLSFSSSFSLSSSELKLKIDSASLFSEKMRAENTAKLDGGLSS